MLRKLVVFCLLINSVQAFGQKYEAEHWSSHTEFTQNTPSAFSGSGYAIIGDHVQKALSIRHESTQAGIFDISFSLSSAVDTSVEVLVNGQSVGTTLLSGSEQLINHRFGKIHLTKGINHISIRSSSPVIVDYLELQAASASEINNVAENLINPNASDKTKRLYNYLKDLYGKRTLSGQQTQYQSSNAFADLDDILAITDRSPAIAGFDLINYSPSRVQRGASSSQVEELMEWADQGGLISLMWHWNAPEDWLRDIEGEEWYRGFYTSATTFDLNIPMNDPNSEEYGFIIRDIDAIAELLLQIEEADIPILWRPLHEAAGRWFWWGAKGPEPCKWLWRLMYDRLTIHHGINNLIWVWTEEHDRLPADWYPGDEYVDIIGLDIYLNANDTDPSFAKFDGTVELHEGSKIVALTEAGVIPDSYEMRIRGAHWSWFTRWSSEFGFGAINERNDPDDLDRFYNDEYVITLDELPDLATYERTEVEEIAVPLSADRHLTNEISAYPNPVSDKLSVNLPDGLEVDLISVINQNGQVVTQIIGNQALTNLSINFSNQPKGIYFVKVLGAGLNKTVRVIRH